MKLTNSSGQSLMGSFLQRIDEHKKGIKPLPDYNAGKLVGSKGIKLMKGDDKIDVVSVDITDKIVYELVEAAYKDRLMSDKEKAQWYARDFVVGVEMTKEITAKAWQRELTSFLTYFEKFTFKDFQKKAPNCLKWFEKYNPLWLEKLKEDVIKEGIALSANMLRRAMFKNKLIDEEQNRAFTKLITKEPQASLEALLWLIPDDYDILWRKAPDTLACLKELDNTRFQKLKNEYSKNLNEKQGKSNASNAASKEDGDKLNATLAAKVALKEDLSKSKAGLAATKLLSALHKNKIITASQIAGFKNLIRASPEAVTTVLLSIIPNDYDKLYRTASETLACMKELEPTRFEALKQRWVKSLKDK